MHASRDISTIFLMDDNMAPSTFHLHPNWLASRMLKMLGRRAKGANLCELCVVQLAVQRRPWWGPRWAAGARCGPRAGLRAGRQVVPQNLLARLRVRQVHEDPLLQSAQQRLVKVPGEFEIHPEF